MSEATETTTPKRYKRKLRIFEFPPSYWKAETSSAPQSVLVPSSEIQQKGFIPDSLPVSDHSVCSTCGQTFTSFIQQRTHFKTDVHKYNAKRKTHGRPPISEQEFDDLDDLGSVESLSGSESGSEDETASPAVVRSGKLAERLEFRNPSNPDTYVVLYKASIPDGESIQSLQERGSWAVIMAGGGHFVAALWNKDGDLLRHKTFHRYTSRRKQGGSQAAADEARGNANRIRSAGATLRRYGEQALQNDVHSLLKEWHDCISEAQCVYLRASQREKRDLLVGWHGSPLKQAQEDGRLRNIPIPTRRATLKEATRVHGELSTLIFSSHSLVEKTEQQRDLQPNRARQASQIPNPKPAIPKSTVKGTSHLKKREETQKKARKDDQDSKESIQPPAVDDSLASLARFCLAEDREQLSVAITANPAILAAQLGKNYFSEDQRFEQLDEAVGLVGVAAVCGSAEFVEWLLDHGAAPTTGASPYLATKSKAVRTALRRYWWKNPDKYDYAAAGIPGPLSEKDLEAAAERDRAKRKKDRNKKKEKTRERAEAAKPPEQRARELRAMAAEARMIGHRCAGCRKSLVGLTPFERLAFKYCSTGCVEKHRSELSRM